MTNTKFEEFVSESLSNREGQLARQMHEQDNSFKKALPEECQVQLRKFLDDSYSQMEKELAEVATQLEKVRTDMCKEFSVSETAIRQVKLGRY